MSCLNCLNDELVTGPIERRVPTEKNIEDNPTAPQIALLSVAFLKDLGCDIIRSSELSSEFLAWVYHGGSPEVDHLDLKFRRVRINEEVLWLQVSI